MRRWLEKEARYGERYPSTRTSWPHWRRCRPLRGCALGFDRLVMLATGATRIDQVIWTPFNS